MQTFMMHDLSVLVIMQSVMSCEVVVFLCVCCQLLAGFFFFLCHLKNEKEKFVEEQNLYSNWVVESRL